MNEERRIEVEEVEAVSAPPRARVEDAPETPQETLARKRDYLDGFLAQNARRDRRGAQGNL